MARFPLRAGGALAAVALLAGCHTGVQTGDSGHARAAVVTFLAVCAEGRGEDAVDLVASEARRAFVEAGDTASACQVILGTVPVKGHVGAFFAATRVTRVSVTGDNADVELTGPGGWRHTVEAERQGDQDWVVTASRLPA